MRSQHAETLRWQIERSPFSESVTVVGNDGWLTVNSGGPSVEFDRVDGGTGDDFGCILVPTGGTVVNVLLRGIFDESVERDEGSKATRRKPRVIVFAWPKEARAGTRVIVRDKEYAVTSYEADANLGMVVWLR